MRKDISQIAYQTLYSVTNGSITLLNTTAINALLNDFLYVWYKNIEVDYKFELLEFARLLLRSENENIFRVTNCKSIDEVRAKIKNVLGDFPQRDNRMILSLHYKNNKIDSKWVEKEEYQENISKK